MAKRDQIQGVTVRASAEQHAQAARIAEAASAVPALRPKAYDLLQEAMTLGLAALERKAGLARE